MRLLFPPPSPTVDHDRAEPPLDLVALYGDAPRPHPGNRPWVLVSMVTSLDGATAVDGVSGPLGGTPDRAAFVAIRSVPDVILVAAGTVRAEGYGPPRRNADALAARAARGQAPTARLAVVSGSLDLDPSLRLFAEAAPDARPLVLTTRSAPPDRRAALEAVADVVEAGDERVDMAEAVAALGHLGAHVVSCEGGPSLNGQLVADGLVDEVCLTLAPALVSGSSARMAHGPPATPEHLRLAHVVEDQGVLLLRYSR